MEIVVPDRKLRTHVDREIAVRDHVVALVHNRRLRVYPSRAFNKPLHARRSVGADPKLAGISEVAPRRHADRENYIRRGIKQYHAIPSVHLYVRDRRNRRRPEQPPDQIHDDRNESEDRRARAGSPKRGRTLDLERDRLPGLNPLRVLNDFLAALVSGVLVPRHHLSDDVLEIDGDIRIDGAGQRRLGVLYLIQDEQRGIAFEGHFPREQFVGDHAERIDVALRGGGSPGGLLGRHVFRRSHDAAVDRESRGALLKRETEVGHFHAARLGYHDVAGLDVAVHYALAMSVSEGLGDLADDRKRPVG